MSNEIDEVGVTPEGFCGPAACPRPYRLRKCAETADRNRRRVVEAARELLCTEGLPGLTMEAVARRAGVSRQTVHNHFGNRRALLEALCASAAAAGGLERMAEVFHEPDALRALEKLVHVLAGLWSADQGLLPRLNGLAAVDPELDQVMAARGERRRWGLARLVERLRAQGCVSGTARPEDLVDALYLLTSFSSYSELAARGRSPEEVTGLIIRLARAVLQADAPGPAG